MSEAEGSNKTIAKNTLYLYGRMILTMAVNLYTVRVVWRVLGVDDYGIYNLVGGIVLIFQFLNNAMIASSQRFISYELGRGDGESLRKVFSLSLVVHVIIALLVLAVAESGGIWFLNNKLNIPDDRMYAANIVYQCSVFAFLVTMISVPYNACIVAHEHMKAYGYLGILDVLLKLGIAFLIIWLPGDKLIVYAFLILLVQICLRVVYQMYCRRHFKECRFRYSHDPAMIKDMFSFAGWSFIGNMGFSVRDQGLNILVNVFFNVAVNAAKGIANQVSGVIMGFTSNFQMALNPQITKRYAKGNIDSMMSLVMGGCRYSFLLLMMIEVPVYIACEPMLRIWLSDVAPFTVGFLRWMFVCSLIDCMAHPITTALQATGRIRLFQIVIAIIMIANIPLAWIWLLFADSPYIVMYVMALTSTLGLFTRMALLKRQIDFRIRAFLKQLLVRMMPCLFVSFSVSMGLYSLIAENLGGLIMFVAGSLAISCLCIMFIGIQREERQRVIGLVVSRIGAHRCK